MSRCVGLVRAMFESAFLRRLVPAVLFYALVWAPAQAETLFHKPWKSKDHALVIDAYEFNALNIAEIAADKRVAGFINKGSDGMPPVWGCKSAVNETEKALCKNEWRLYAVSRELFHTRKELTKALGLKWGSYHLGRTGNPIDQANHFIDFTDPQPDELIAIDIEDTSSGKYISLADAEEFARHIHRRLGRYPLLYANENVAKQIALQRKDYPLLSRLPLWYARYKPEIVGAFPKGNWDNYALWQFASHLNCGKNTCPHRIGGTGSDIDINVAATDVKTLKANWPLGGLVPTKDLQSDEDFSLALMAVAERLAEKAKPVVTYLAALLPENRLQLVGMESETTPYGVDPVVTASIGFDRPTGRMD